MAKAAKKTESAARSITNIRMSDEDRYVIDRAAKGMGQTRTQFMIEAARRAAQEALLDTTLVMVDGTSFNRFKDMFDAPAAPPEGLRRLMGLQAPWEP